METSHPPPLVHECVHSFPDLVSLLVILVVLSRTGQRTRVVAEELIEL
jgi:hypothetical protein